MRPWHLGNTTVRSPFRLRDGLIVLSRSDLQGNLRGTENDAIFRKLLGDSGLVSLGDDKTNSVGRKWRSALSQLGFIYSDKSNKDKIDRITPSGTRLISADSVPAIQECFLRSLICYQIPSLIEQKYSYKTFSPLRHVLKLLLFIENNTDMEPFISFQEMAVIVQLSSPETPLDVMAEKIASFRKEKKLAINKRKFGQMSLTLAAREHGYVEQTFNDYSDTNIRYLKATGLFSGKGRGITLNPQKIFLINKLAEGKEIIYSDEDYLAMLSEGATLPTDNKPEALQELEDLTFQLGKFGVKYDASNANLAKPADIAIVRHKVEELLGEQKEIEFAKRQASEWEEILTYFELIIDRKSAATLSEDNEIRLPKSEVPAYFEWALWRAFLAINKLKNPPYESRRFKVDQDILPIGNAPGNGPDLIFEFEDYVLVVEATLTDNSRQEAAEGEPVRRHVAQAINQYGENKPVFGLFVANQIDSNTAETFRSGVWYNTSDSKAELGIVPMTLTQFSSIFRFLFSNDKVDNRHILEVIKLCLDKKDEYTAPEWKERINTFVLNYRANPVSQQ
ncbi:MAG: AlwI family type II restriction endonuclease [Patescibacteria group bacterium]|nr:AlwI family type II restriction endonuclease [Patescibacteria group bacterium]